MRRPFALALFAICSTTPAVAQQNPNTVFLENLTWGGSPRRCQGRQNDGDHSDRRNRAERSSHGPGQAQHSREGQSRRDREAVGERDRCACPGLRSRGGYSGPQAGGRTQCGSPGRSRYPKTSTKRFWNPRREACGTPVSSTLHSSATAGGINRDRKSCRKCSTRSGPARMSASTTSPTIIPGEATPSRWPTG